MALPSAAVEACPNHPDAVSGLVACARCGIAWCPDCVVEIEGLPYDANCKEERVRDLRSGTASASLAGAGRRLVALWVDGLVVLPLWLGIILLFSGSQPEPGLATALAPLALPLLVQFIYEAWMLASFDGQTLGKKALKIKVTRPDGSAISTGQAVGRTLSRVVMNATYVLGIVDGLMIFSRDRRTLHDRFATTVVVNWNP